MIVHIKWIEALSQYPTAHLGIGDGSGHETVAVLLPGFAINWYQNQVTRQSQIRDQLWLSCYLVLLSIDSKTR